jgi:hypothetical protein
MESLLASEGRYGVAVHPDRDGAHRSEKALAGRQLRASEVGMKDDQLFLKEASNIVECLCNLNYLICEEAERPEKVRQYASLSDQRLQAMIELLRGE